MTILKRILYFIPVAIMFLVTALIQWVRHMILYARYGGETIIYNTPKDRIFTVYSFLEQHVACKKAEEITADLRKYVDEINSLRETVLTMQKEDETLTEGDQNI